MEDKSVKKYNGLFWVIGLCAFVALMCSGFSWILGLCGITGGIFNTIKNVANIVLIVVAVASGWIWISSAKMNKTLKLVLEIFFIIFAVLAVLGVIGLGI